MVRLLNLAQHKHRDMLEQHSLDVLTRLIFSSNYISDIRLDYNITFKICTRIFQRENIVEQITERDPEYQKLRVAYTRKDMEEDLLYDHEHSP